MSNSYTQVSKSVVDFLMPSVHTVVSQNVFLENFIAQEVLQNAILSYFHICSLFFVRFNFYLCIYFYCI